MEENQMELPEGWKNISKLESFGKVFNGLSGKKKDDFGYGEPYIPYVNVFKNAEVDITEIDFVYVRKGEKQNELIYGDIIFTTSSETVEEVGMTSVFLAKKGKYFLNSFCFIFRLSDIGSLLPEYAQYLFRSEKVRYNISLLGQGSTRYNLSKTRLLKELTFNVPENVTEQRQIATILNKVDEAISQTEKLRAKYSRIKTGLMQDLLTKGIDEHGNIRSEATHEFKDSPLGRIPVEWDVKSLDLLTQDDICYGIVQVGKNVFGGVRTIAIKDLNTNYESVHLTDVDIEKRYSRSRVNGGEILLSIKATTDKVDIVPKGFIGNISRDVAKLKFNNDIIPLFYKYYFLSEFGRKVLDSITIGSTRKEISIAPLKRIEVLKPKKEEQARILNTIKSCDISLNKIKEQASKLQSIKKGLMQDLLSGKVRVNYLISEMASA
ncbi:hypothetical protein FVR03_22170 [Pontibacter qinzhouensis]|uniref:Type I restriction modification DNA specificity domain-containing protein n=1 Tax=Pontibacter qinzhouensis TaxID=2603253 RepID=A0A5C8IV43_9BACT|nr:restriction endonuclease subunit S [Pontibacter qinzhouensis]TXK24924.1 hypothetical protein FVR03_22170 [Pontibacter qinzhouensis]